jgi:predicted naringenin-chalcone synthase
MTTTGFINRIATAVPPHDVHRAFVDFAETMLPVGTSRNLFKRMARLSAIDHRYSFVEPVKTNSEGWQDAENIYVPGCFPSTARRMQVFEKFAPKLAGCALNRLAVTEDERRSISHVVVTSCTGLYAPGLDFDIIRHLGLNPSVERTMIGFMGCYAAVNALKYANYIVRAQPDAKVLVLNLELCSLHFQETTELEQVLSFLLFADGCSASLVSAEPQGLTMDSFLAVELPESHDLITWRVGDGGFDMHLSGQVPGEIRRAMKDVGSAVTRGRDPQAIDLWAVHPGGRTILDAVEQGLDLPTDALRFSRDILSRYGNMSSATVMFVLQKVMAEAQSGQQGCAMSFGPGVTAETMLFHAV